MLKALVIPYVIFYQTELNLEIAEQIGTEVAILTYTPLSQRIHSNTQTQDKEKK